MQEKEQVALTELRKFLLRHQKNVLQFRTSQMQALFLVYIYHLYTIIQLKSTSKKSIICSILEDYPESKDSFCVCVRNKITALWAFLSK